MMILWLWLVFTWVSDREDLFFCLHLISRTNSAPQPAKTFFCGLAPPSFIGLQLNFRVPPPPIQNPGYVLVAQNFQSDGCGTIEVLVRQDMMMNRIIHKKNNGNVVRNIYLVNTKTVFSRFFFENINISTIEYYKRVPNNEFIVTVKIWNFLHLNKWNQFYFLKSDFKECQLIRQKVKLSSPFY